VRRKAAEAELGRGAPVTEAIHASGYATASRFYDGVGATLGMAPGAARRGGLGEVIRYVHADTSLGRMIVGFSAAGVCAVQFGEDDAALVKEVSRRFPRACLEPADDTALPVQHIVDIVDGKTKGEDLPLDIRGTAFQARVWAALRAIPSGQTASYAEIAERIGKPSATRAVAQACGANHIAVLVPCHRVVRADGGLAGYRWGVARKRNLLGREGARAIEETSR
jgi:AraC family transcriptional regulator of adaptative response/methylated-DNA-[protein]-cysteine methyltransferase